MRRFLSFVIIALASFALAFPSPNVFAENEELTTIEPANNAWLQISPTTKRLRLDPSEVDVHHFTLENTGEKELKVDVYSAPYSIVQGTADLDFKSETHYTQIGRWISFSKDDENYHERLQVSLPAGESRTMSYRITVPESVASGGQYASIFAEVVPDEVEGITTTTRVGLLLYASINGETHTSSKVSNIKSNFISTNGKIGLSADIENTGNIDYQAAIDISVSTFFGKELYNNTVVSSILPESLKKVSAEWDSGSGYGLYRLNYAIKALDISVEGSRVVLVLPMPVLILGLVLLVAIIIAIVYLIRKRKSSAFIETE